MKEFIKKIEIIKTTYNDLIITQSIQQEINFWKFRDDLVEAYKMEGKIVTNDISIPLDKIDIFFKTAASHLSKIPLEIKLHPFGHLGDNNIHFNMVLPKIKDLKSHRIILNGIFIGWTTITILLIILYPNLIYFIILNGVCSIFSLVTILSLVDQIKEEKNSLTDNEIYLLQKLANKK